MNLTRSAKGLGRLGSDNTARSAREGGPRAGRTVFGSRARGH